MSNMLLTHEAALPTGVFGILARSWRITRENLPMVLAISLGLGIPSGIIFSLLPVGSETASLREVANWTRLWQLLLDATFGFVASLMYILLADADMNGKKVTFHDLFRRSLRIYPKALGTSIMMGVSLAFGFLCLIIPGIYFTVLWSFMLPIVAVLNLYGWSAMKKSTELVKGRWFKTFGYYISFFVIFLGIGIILALPKVGLTWAIAQRHLVAVASYADLTSSSAFVTVLLELATDIPLLVATAFEAMASLVMFRVWQGTMSREK